MNKTIYLIRHGETDSKKLGVFQAHGTPLSNKGVRQVSARGVYFSDRDIPRIESSPIKRALQSATIIGDYIKVNPSINRALQEIKNPLEIQGLPYTDSAADIKYRAWLSKLKNTEGLGSEEEENYLDLLNRTSELLNSWEESSYNKIIAVSHSVTIRSIVALVLCNREVSKRSINMIEKLKIDNCGIVVITHSSDGWLVSIEN